MKRRRRRAIARRNPKLRMPAVDVILVGGVGLALLGTAAYFLMRPTTAT